ncbi:MAG: glycosyl hydrolase family 8 [Chthoniobacteraceae bacterium]
MKLWLAIAVSSLAALPVPAGRGADEARPFPVHTVYARGTLKPSRRQEDLDRAVLEAYREWKAAYLQSTAGGAQRYVACNTDGSFSPKATRSVSEGHGYGMLVAVLMAGADPEAHRDFDALFAFLRAHPAKGHPALMAWRQSARGDALVERKEDHETATDGDLDIALSLLMADRQWGSRGAVDYRAEALSTIRAIRDAETDAAHGTLALGSWVGRESKQWGGTRPSDFMPAHLKAFGAATGDPLWARVTDGSYRVFSDLTRRYSPQTGLLPDFAAWRGAAYRPAPGGFLEGETDGDFAYNACRVPWRLGTDCLLTGDERARALLAPFNAWAERVCGGDPAWFNAGYRLDGTALKEDASAAFTGPLAVAAMTDPARQKWLDALWAHLAARSSSEEGYYGNTIRLLTMIVISGNWWQP